MTDNLLADDPRDESIATAAHDGETAADRPQPPSGIPEKFWDSDKGELRADALVKSYVELEKKLGSHQPAGIPEAPDGYTITANNELLQSDDEINGVLHAAGFTQEQAQLVYDLAGERLMPMVTEIASAFETRHQVARLAEHFGGEERWRESARQIATWGRSHFPPQVFEALSTTFDGVLAMHRMMANEEPKLVRDGATTSSTPSEAVLRQMMRDPRYWRDQEPTFVATVREGFRRLYPD